MRFTVPEMHTRTEMVVVMRFYALEAIDIRVNKLAELPNENATKLIEQSRQMIRLVKHFIY